MQDYAFTICRALTAEDTRKTSSDPALNDTLGHHHRSITRIVYLKHRENTVFVEKIKFLMELSPCM